MANNRARAVLTCDLEDSLEDEARRCRCKKTHEIWTKATEEWKKLTGDRDKSRMRVHIHETP